MDQLAAVPHLSIIVPAFNEEAGIGQALEQLKHWLAHQSYGWEVIVVDDGSHDGTAHCVAAAAQHEPRFRLLRHESNSGKGFAVKAGMLTARGAYVGFMDADLSTDLEGIDRALDFLHRGVPVVIGSRRLPGARILVPQSRGRRLGSLFFILAAKTVLGLDDIWDSQCGFKFFRAAIARELFELQTLDGFLFDVEILMLARWRGYAIQQIPVTWSNRRDRPGRILGFAYETVRDLWRVKQRLARLPAQPF